MNEHLENQSAGNSNHDDGDNVSDMDDTLASSSVPLPPRYDALMTVLVTMWHCKRNDAKEEMTLLADCR